MPRNEEGEFELILGNRQLLSIFFLVVVLLGVFFTMGYIVGRNSGPVTSEIATDRTPATTAPPVVVGGGRSSAMPEPAAEKPTPNYDVRTESGNPSASQPMKPEPVKPEPPKPEVKKPEPKPVERAEPKRPEPKKPEPAKPEPKGQSYFQVVAVAKPDAERTVAALKAKSLPASIMPGPDDTIFRVVVGPLGDATSTSELRAKLEAAGFKPILKRF